MKNTGLDSLAKAIERRRRRVLTRKGYVNLAIRIVVIAAAAVILFTQIFMISQASGNEMFPAVKDGDLLIGYRLEKNLQKNDIVIYEENGHRRVGRIAALGGDVVTLDDSGTFLVNGTVQSGEIMYPTYAKEGFEYPLKIPEDSVFILADYRTRCEDSRDFGPIPIKNIKGKVITLIRRRGM